jgi:hypothetical protein
MGPEASLLPLAAVTIPIGTAALIVACRRRPNLRDGLLVAGRRFHAEPHEGGEEVIR